jgi:hypothetical protein
MRSSTGCPFYLFPEQESFIALEAYIRQIFTDCLLKTRKFNCKVKSNSKLLPCEGIRDVLQEHDKMVTLYIFS